MKNVAKLLIIFIVVLCITIGFMYIYINNQTNREPEVTTYKEEFIVGNDKNIEEKKLNIYNMDIHQIKNAMIDSIKVRNKEHFVISSMAYHRDSFIQSTTDYWVDGDKFKTTHNMDRTIPETMKSNLISYRDIVYDGYYYKILEDKLNHIKISKDINKLKLDGDINPFKETIRFVIDGEFLDDGTYFILENGNKLYGKWELYLDTTIFEDKKTEIMEDKEIGALKIDIPDIGSALLLFDVNEFRVYSYKVEYNEIDFTVYEKIITHEKIENYPSDFFNVRSHSTDLKEVEY